MTERSFFNKMGWFLAIYMGVWIGLQLLLTLLVEQFAPAAIEKEWVFWLISMAPMYLVAFPVLLALFKKLPGRTLYKHSLKSGHLVQLYAMAVALMLIGNIIGIILTSVLTNATGLNFTVDSTDLVLEHGLGWVLLIAVIIGPIIEEVIFRKVLIDRLVIFGDGIAIVVSALLFGFIHGNFSQFFYATGLGLVFGFVYVRTGKLKYTIGLHMVFNFFGGFIPALFMKKIDFTVMEDALMQGNISFIFDKIGVLLGFVGFELAIFAIGIIGFILLILHRKKFKLNQGECYLKKGEVVKLFFTTPGMIVWMLATAGLFILNITGI